ncbi:MAG: hypothetical protein A3J76_03240 [Candidatus Moranbacteria bacterium RBG_13_45_13]|nr:MAG: hypothetical protein A3J76_03240 [Candidatus Moranbacteria bacterium RBG_13_45_13]
MTNKKTKNFSQQGLTLVEMLIAIFIFVMMMTGSAFLLSQIYKRYGFAMEQGMSVNETQRVMKIMVEEIRRARQADSGAYAVVSADDFDFVFYSDIDADGETERVHYYLEDSAIKKGTAEPSGIPPTYPGNDQSVSTIAENIQNALDEPLFSYYNSDYPDDQINNPLAVPVAQVSQIRLIKVDIFFNLDPFHAPDNIRLESYVEMRNLKDNW